MKLMAWEVKLKYYKACGYEFKEDDSIKERIWNLDRIHEPVVCG